MCLKIRGSSPVRLEITLFMVILLATVEEINLALRHSHCDQFIAQLPDGLETILGEGGAGLSGGQKQRLAIARAMIKSPRMPSSRRSYQFVGCG